MDSRTKIVNRLKTLQAIDGVTVTVNDEKKIVFVNYQTGRFLDFKFVWSDDHFIGYFTDSEGNESHAVISIWEPLEAIHFVTAYDLLAGLREEIEESEDST
jgi:hypothetical protein